MTIAGTDPSILRIDATTGIRFDKTGLRAPNTWLILAAVGPAKSSGHIVVGALDIAVETQSGGALLTGSVGGQPGTGAAALAGIFPATNPAYRINDCPIASIDCVLVTQQGVPLANPLRDVAVGSIFSASDADDLLLPLVSDGVY